MEDSGRGLHPAVVGHGLEQNRIDRVYPSYHMQICMLLLLFLLLLPLPLCYFVKGFLLPLRCLASRSLFLAFYAVTASCISSLHHHVSSPSFAFPDVSPSVFLTELLTISPSVFHCRSALKFYPYFSQPQVPQIFFSLLALFRSACFFSRIRS